MPSQYRWLPLAAGCVLLRIAPGAAQSAPKVGGYVQVRETYQSPIGLTATLNRVRSSLEGSLPGSFSYRILVEYEASGTATTAASVSLRDAYIRWRHEAVSVTAGQFKAPFSREYLTSITAIETPDRATVVDSLAPKRDIGQETFQRPAIAAGQSTVATTAGINTDLSGGRVRLVADYVSRRWGSPGARNGVLVTQLQVRF